MGVASHHALFAFAYNADDDVNGFHHQKTLGQMSFLGLNGRDFCLSGVNPTCQKSGNTPRCNDVSFLIKFAWLHPTLGHYSTTALILSLALACGACFFARLCRALSLLLLAFATFYAG